jgi:hypothetical protein
MEPVKARYYPFSNRRCNGTGLYLHVLLISTRQQHFEVDITDFFGLKSTTKSQRMPQVAWMCPEAGMTIQPAQWHRF